MRKPLLTASPIELTDAIASTGAQRLADAKRIASMTRRGIEFDPTTATIGDAEAAGLESAVEAKVGLARAARRAPQDPAVIIDDGEHHRLCIARSGHKLKRLCWCRKSAAAHDRHAESKTEASVYAVSR